MILDRTFDRIGEWSRRRERTYVERPERARIMLVGDLVLFVIVFACWALWSRFLGTPIGVVIACVVGFQLGRSALLGVRRAQTYRSGWLDGRAAMMLSLGEALRRGMSPDQWAEAELTRDLNTMGAGEADVAELMRHMRDDGQD